VRPHTVRRPRLALGDGAATRVGFLHAAVFDSDADWYAARPLAVESTPPIAREDHIAELYTKRETNHYSSKKGEGGIGGWEGRGDGVESGADEYSALAKGTPAISREDHIAELYTKRKIKYNSKKGGGECCEWERRRDGVDSGAASREPG